MEQSATQLPLMRSSVIIGIVILLKAYLKALYSLSEEYVLSVEHVYIAFKLDVKIELTYQLLGA